MSLRELRRLLMIAFAVMLGSSAQRALAADDDQRPPPDRQILVMVRIAPDHYRPSGSYGTSYGDQLGQSAREHVARAVAHRYGLTLVDNWPMPMVGVDCFVMSVPEGGSPSVTASVVSRDAEVSWAQPVTMYTAHGAPAGHNDALYAAEPAAVVWHLGDLHRMADGRGSRVAVVDSGIDAKHPDLSGQLLINRNFVSGQPFAIEQHGTAVAGIIAAKADNRIGIAGVAPGARLLGLRACWQRAGSPTLCDTLSLAKALYFAVQTHADVINMSLSGPEDRLLREIITLALEKRLAVVAAFDNKVADGGFPASVAGVIPVSDSSLAGSRADVYIAPGRDVPTTEPGGRWFLVNGSSFAAAHVSGLIALLHGRQMSAPVNLVSDRRGGGNIDACATLFRLVGKCDCTCPSGWFAAAGDHH
ncbi:MAG TPA: S8 family serine peptidase [Sphingomicrobium sp.]|nr:S8 family serine peptidase [Sphingomicrobium sp.]